MGIQRCFLVQCIPGNCHIQPTDNVRSIHEINRFTIFLFLRIGQTSTGTTSMVSFAKRLRAENTEKSAAHLFTVAILFARFGGHTENSYAHRHRTRSVQEVWGSRSTQLSVGHSIHILGAIHKFARLLAVDHIVCIGRRIHLCWHFTAFCVGGRSHSVQFNGHTHPTTWHHDILEHQIVGHSSGYTRTERWTVGLFHRSRFIGE